MNAKYSWYVNLVYWNLENQSRTERIFYAFQFFGINPAIKHKPGSSLMYFQNLPDDLRRVSNLNMGFLGLRFPGADPKSEFQKGLESFLVRVQQSQEILQVRGLNNSYLLFLLLEKQVQQILDMEITLQEDLTTNALKKSQALKVVDAIEAIIFPEIIREATSLGLNQDLRSVLEG